MKQFMDQDFLLSTPTAQKLYHDYAAEMPIIDYHCHVSPQEIFEDRRFENITQVWLGGDHYKWRVMYHWCHLELKKYFGYTGTLNGETAEEVWNLCNQKLQEPGMSVRGLIAQSNVAFVGTTDDPIDSLEWHQKIAADDSIKTIVAPSFRPDKAVNIDKAGWKDYIEKLGAVCGYAITDSAALEKALGERIAHFNAAGCRASDHGLDYVAYRPADRAAVDAVFAKGMRGEIPTAEEAEIFKTQLVLFCAREYAKRGWVMQMHYNCLRNPNKRMFAELGPDTGYDVINTVNCGEAVAGLLNALEETGELPRTILYSLNPADNQLLDTILGAFQGTEVPGKVQHGSAWWFNDTKTGMTEQMTSLANLGLLGNFVGMLTDSRSFLSYTRHEYFRRILCDLLGKWVENGEYPADMAMLEKIVRGISYNNAARYFGIE